MRRLTGTALLCLLPALVACGPAPLDAGEVVSQDADEVAADGALKSTDPLFFTVRGDVRRCAYPMCGGYWVTPLQRKSVYCADGKRAASCYVPDLDTSELSLPGELEGALVRDLHDGARTVVLLGVIRKAPKTGGNASFGALQAFHSDTRLDEAAGLTWWRATTHDQPCDFQPCATLALQKLNSTTKKTIHGLELDPALPLADRDAAMLAAYSDPGLLFAGTTRTVRNGTERLTYAASKLSLSKYALADDERLCDENLEETILHASTGLLQMSESDAPFSYVARDVSTSRALTIAKFRSTFGIAAGARVELSSLDRFFAGSTRDEAGMTPSEQASAAQFRHLRAVLEAQLGSIQVFRVGEISIDVYVVGRNACGRLAGVKTNVVET